MSGNVAKTNERESNWETAKKIASASYPKIDKKDNSYWKITMSLYRNMNGKPSTSIEKAVR